MKICSSCKVTKPIIEFHKDKSKPDGYDYKCKECKKLYYNKNKDKILTKQKEYCDKNREVVRQRNRDNYNKNKDKVAQRVIEYRQTDKGKEVQRKVNHRRRGFGDSESINKYFDGSQEHHLHISNTSDTIFIPEELHRSIYHAYNNQESMNQINVQSLIWWIDNELENADINQIHKIRSLFNF